MALTLIGGIAEIGTAIAHHGLLTYIGTNLGNLYSMVNTTGVSTLLGSVGEKIVSISIEHPTIWVSTSKGNIYSYAITVSGDLAESTSIGSQANTAGSGVPISTTYPGAFRVFSDDGGANVGDSVRGIQSRTLLTVDQSAGTIRALQGQLKALNGVDFATGIYTAVQGYIELAGTHVVASTGVLAAFDASIEIGTALTATGYVAGFRAELTGAGTCGAGLDAGFLVTNAAGAAVWTHGLYVEASAVDKGVYIGACTTGIELNGVMTTGIQITNATFGVTSARAIKVSTSQAAAAMEDGYGVVEIDHTITGTAGSNFSGCALSAWVNIPSGTVGSGKYVCAQNNGVYEDAAATITGARIIFGLRAQKLLGDTDAYSFPFSLNTNNTAITAVFDVNNDTDMGWVTGTLSGATKVGHVPLFRDNAGVIHYVNTLVD